MYKGELVEEQMIHGQLNLVALLEANLIEELNLKGKIIDAIATK